jgi:hypothetical protein
MQSKARDVCSAVTTAAKVHIGVCTIVHIDAESSDEEQYPEDRRAEMDQDPPLAPLQDTGSTAAADTSVEHQPTDKHQPTDSAGTGAASRHGSPVQAQPEASQREAASQRKALDVGAFFDHPTVSAAGHRDLPDEDAENQPTMAPYVHIPEEERRQLADDFLQ